MSKQKHPPCHLSPTRFARIREIIDASYQNWKKRLTIKRLFFYCQPYYQVLLSWYKRLFCRCLNTKSWQMTIECPKNSLCRSNSDPLISLYEIGDQSEIPVVFSLFLSVWFWMMNEELAALSRCKVIHHSSFFISQNYIINSNLSLNSSILSWPDLPSHKHNIWNGKADNRCRNQPCKLRPDNKQTLSQRKRTRISSFYLLHR